MVDAARPQGTGVASHRLEFDPGLLNSTEARLGGPGSLSHIDAQNNTKDVEPDDSVENSTTIQELVDSNTVDMLRSALSARI